eukprot:7377171-Prymnesium_polylepis.3
MQTCVLPCSMRARLAGTSRDLMRLQNVQTLLALDLLALPVGVFSPSRPFGSGLCCSSGSGSASSSMPLPHTGSSWASCGSLAGEGARGGRTLTAHE